MTQAAVQSMGDLPAFAPLIESMATIESEVAGPAELVLAERIRRRILLDEERATAEQRSTIAP